MRVGTACQLRRAIVLPTIIALLAAFFGPGWAIAADSAVVLMYHRFGEDQYPSTNVTIEQFEAHIAELSRDAYSVKSLPEIVAAIRAGRSLPENTVGISIDDAYLSVYREAWPRLRKASFPFTVFVATEQVDNGSPNQMTWNQIREMADAGVTIGNHTVTHAHMPLLSASRNAAEINDANARFKAELGIVPNLIAYPYGEYSLAVGKVTRQAGFTVGFGQHSGVIHRTSDFLNLPRFAFNESYADIDRLRVAARALPLLTSDVTPADMLLRKSNNPPLFGFTVDNIPPNSLSRLACYVSGQGKAQIERLGEKRIEVRMAHPFRTGRTRINCTFPEKERRWRWFGRQFIVPPG
jgi:peptidoglycan/xylan/chitin deacetylase (PgdA/CDA1 family)